jgi:predicted small metal-binding protein
MMHLTYYPCPYVECNWWAAVETVMEGRAALVEHAREVHSVTTEGTSE